MENMSGWKQLGYFILLVLGSLIAVNLLLGLVAVVVAFATGEGLGVLSSRTSLLIMQFISQVFIFFVPSYLYLRIQKKSVISTMDLDKKSGWRIYIYAVAMFLLAIPVNDMLMKLNQDVSFPQSLLWLETLLKEKEAQMAMLTETMLDTTSIMGLFNGLVVVALMAAVGEELLFRGVLQKILIRVFKNPHVGIVITAFLFSAIHGQFYGFFARMFIGLMLGYMYFYTRNLKIPIMFHFINNATMVVFYFLWKKGIVNVNPMNDISNSPSFFTAFIAVVAIVLIVRQMYRKQKINDVKDM